MSVIKKKVDNINGYLLTTKRVNIVQEKASIFNLPTMFTGGVPACGGFLLMSFAEKTTLILDYPECKPYIKRYMGGEEFLNGNLRYCIRIERDTPKIVIEIPPFKKAFEKVRNFRLSSKSPAINKSADKPYLFNNIKPYKEKEGLCIPVVSSKDRLYIPIGFCDKDTIPNNKLHVIYDWSYYIFALLTSRLHMLWCSAISCRIGGRSLSYSKTLIYNTFPIPKLNEEEKGLLSQYARCILKEREDIGGTLVELYNPKGMPKSLLEIHKELDNYLDTLYMKESGVQTLANDDDRLTMLFTMYQKRKGELK